MKKLLLIILFSTYLVAGCNTDLIGKFTINETFKKDQSAMMGGGDPFIEIAKVDSGADFKDTWKVRVRTNDVSKDYSLTVCDSDEYASFNLDSDDELDFENGMSISLVDENGKYIDYFVLQGNDVEGNLNECSYDYETELTFTNNEDSDRDIYRDPDKTGDWIYEESSGGMFLGSGSDGTDCEENNVVDTVYVNDDGTASDDDDTDCDNPNFDNIPDAMQKIRDQDTTDAKKIIVCEGSYDLGSNILEFDDKDFNNFTFQGENRKEVNIKSTADIFFNINHADIEKITITGLRLDHDVSCNSTCDDSKSIFGFTKNKNDADSKITMSNMGYINSGCQTLNFNSNFGGAYKFSGFGDIQSECTPFKIEDCSNDDKFTFSNIRFKLSKDVSDQYGLYLDVDDSCDISIKNIALDMQGSAGIWFKELGDFEYNGFIFKNSGSDDDIHALYVKKSTGTKYTFNYFDINASGRAFEFKKIDSETEFTLGGRSNNHSIMRSRNSHGFQLPSEITKATIANTDIYPDTEAAINLELTGDFNLTNSISSSEKGIQLSGDIDKLTIENSSINATDTSDYSAVYIDSVVSNGVNIKDIIIDAGYKGLNFKDDISKDLNISNTSIIARNGNSIQSDGIIKNALNISDSTLYSYGSEAETIRINNEIQGDVLINNLTAYSDEYYTIYLKKSIQNLTIQNSEINASEKFSLYIYDVVNGDVNIKDTNMTSKKETIYTRAVLKGDLIIKNSDINSTNYMGIAINKEVSGELNITTSNIYGKDYGAYIYDDAKINISDSNITSENEYAFTSKADKKLTVSGSCIMSPNKDYSFWIQTKDTDINNNCFKSNDVNKLAYAKNSGSTFTNNSWYDWGKGDYSNSHKVEDSGTQHCSLGCYPDDVDDANFTAFDSFRNDSGDIEDVNISTKIMGIGFDLNISAVDSDNNITDFNGTLCYQIQDTDNNSSWLEADFNRTEIVNIPDNEVTFISKDAWIFMKWHENENQGDTNCSEELDGNVSSIDHFSIRPKEFFINLSDSTVKAGSDFNLSFIAGKDSSTPSDDYNETNSGSGASFDVNATEQNPNAISGTFDPDITADVNFTDGTKDFINITYNEVGVVDINISEDSKPCSEKYASIDCDDKNISGYWNTDDNVSITTKVETLRITPHHFNVTVKSQNFKGGSFTYVAESNLTLMSALVDINVTAQNENNETTKNYNKDCYANDVNMDYNYTSVDENLSQFLYYYEFSDKNSSENNVSVNNRISDDLNKTSFSTDNNGSAIFKIKYNFKRDRSTPINPFDVEVPNFNAVDSNSSDVNGSGQDTSNANFCWGRTKADDIDTQKDDVKHVISIEVYDDAETSYTRTFTQNSLKWYQHENHNRVIEGNISATDATTTSKLDNIVFSVSDIKSPNNGDINITISNSIEDTYYMHEKIRPWLWYTVDGYGDDYNISSGSSCSAHPCFKYTLDKDDSGSGNTISSGDYNGGDAPTKSTGENTRIGIKVYR